MLTIWKYEIYHPVAGLTSTLEMPAGARVLGVKEQNNTLQLWAVVDTNMIAKGLVKKHLFVVGTGHELPANAGPYIGTGVLHNGELVLHVFHEGV